MKSISATAALTILLACSATIAVASDEPADMVGKSLPAFEAAFGKPLMTSKAGNTVKWLYPDFTVVSKDGKTVSSVGEDGAGTLTLVKDPPKPKGGEVKDLIIYANDGNNINLADVLVPGKITIVDFFADWCGPCQQLGPILEKMAADDPDVVLRKIDIKTWGTPVCKQYSIEFVPNVRVFNAAGKQIGGEACDPSEITDLIDKARK